MNTFPTTLPIPLLSSFGGTVHAGVVHVSMALGNVRTRRVHTAMEQTYTAVWRLTAAQTATLTDFVKAQGVDPFYMQLKVPGDPFGIRTVPARFVSGMSQRRLSDDITQIGMRLRVSELPVVTEAYDLLSLDGSPLMSLDGAQLTREITE